MFITITSIHDQSHDKEVSTEMFLHVLFSDATFQLTVPNHGLTSRKEQVKAMWQKCLHLQCIPARQHNHLEKATQHMWVHFGQGRPNN
jgi:hypothetical protein